jgi:hypothetical protein
VKFRHYLQLLLLFVFFFVFQAGTIHSKYHFLEKAEHCHLCEATKHLDAQNHESALPLFLEFQAIELSEVTAQQQSAKESLDLTQSIDKKAVDLDGRKVFHPHKPILTYQALAPPLFFS